MRTLRLALILGFLGQLGCASFGHKLKSFLGGEDTAKAAPQAEKSDLTKYSDNPELPPGVRRQYKRTTKESLANESALDQKSGSLWVMEGQGAYLFAQNVMRLIGDPIGVQIEGEPKEQLQAKADVLRDLINKINERQAARQRALAAENGDEKPKDAKDDKDKEKDKDKKTADNKAQEQKADFNVKIVPTRIIERTVEGNYRVKGSQPFLIGQREFKVIVTGVVRAEEFSDDGIPASKLLDPKFDIVSVKHQGAEL
jgi:flagellar L-ring protein precursor FlgH